MSAAGGGGKVRVFSSAHALAVEAAHLIADHIEGVLAARGNAQVVLAGGTTTRRCYRYLGPLVAALGLDANRIGWFVTDERWVAPDDPRSEERMIRQALFPALPPDYVHFYSWHAENHTPVQQAALFDRTLRGLFPGNEIPDLVILGLGEDGHAAGLVPGGRVHLSRGRVVEVAETAGKQLTRRIEERAAAVERPHRSAWRLTMTPRFLLTSRRILFLVDGERKRDILRRVLSGDRALPATWLAGSRTTFLVSQQSVFPYVAAADS